MSVKSSGAGLGAPSRGFRQFGLLLAAVAFYAALAFEMKGVQQREVLPVWRSGSAEEALISDEAPSSTGSNTRRG